jgi:PTH1 family peptidyl-tRNA hydrolase
MKLIVGLGNPGRVYQGTRHNIGSYVVKALAKEYNVSLKKGIFASSLSGKANIFGQEVILAVPLVFMNLSGIAVNSLIKKHKIDLENLMVVFDDLDLELGSSRIRADGSSGGHKGLQSLISALRNSKFARLRIGIGRPKAKGTDIVKYVLSPFSQKEKKIMQEVTENCCLALKVWISSGISKTMNIFNRSNEAQTYGMK